MRFTLWRVGRSAKAHDASRKPRSAEATPGTDDGRVRHQLQTAAGQMVKQAQTRMRTRLWPARKRLARPSSGLRILFYHRVADDPTDLLTVTCEVFEGEMSLLAERGYEVLDVVSALDRLYDGELEPRTVALTFDDGYVDNTENALPVLERFGFRGTVFVLGDLAATNDPFLPGSSAPLLSWDEIKRLDGVSPLSFEPHSLTHPDLTRVSDAASWHEIHGSGSRLEAVLGRPKNVFCYPGGFAGAREREYVRASGYRYGITTEPGVNHRSTDRYLIRRIQMNQCDRVVDFAAKLEGSHDRPLLGRQIYRRFIYGAGNPLNRSAGPGAPLVLSDVSQAANRTQTESDRAGAGGVAEEPDGRPAGYVDQARPP